MSILTSKHIVVILIASILFLLFVLFSYLVHNDYFIHFDFSTTVRLQDHIGRRWDGPLSIFSLLGSFEVATAFLLVVVAILRKWRGIVALFLFLSIHLFELYGKLFVTQAGTPFMFHRTKLDIIFPSSYVQPGFSYPSGHAARTGFIVVFLGAMVWESKRLSLVQKLLIWGVLLAFDWVMVLSRVYLAEHWASDVIGGSLLGMALASFSAWLYINRNKNIS